MFELCRFVLVFSAGVGRTGAFIALDYLLDQAKAEGQVDIYGLTRLMRKNRGNMIQTVVSGFCSVYYASFVSAYLRGLQSLFSQGQLCWLLKVQQTTRTRNLIYLNRFSATCACSSSFAAGRLQTLVGRIWLADRTLEIPGLSDNMVDWCYRMSDICIISGANRTNISVHFDSVCQLMSWIWTELWNVCTRIKFYVFLH